METAMTEPRARALVRLKSCYSGGDRRNVSAASEPQATWRSRSWTSFILAQPLARREVFQPRPVPAADRSSRGLRILRSHESCAIQACGAPWCWRSFHEEPRPSCSHNTQNWVRLSPRSTPVPCPSLSCYALPWATAVKNSLRTRRRRKKRLRPHVHGVSLENSPGGVPQPAASWRSAPLESPPVRCENHPYPRQVSRRRRRLRRV